jgi:eukaryotic-like serine/threonine-protein kinase
MGNGSRLAAPRIEAGRRDVTSERWQEVKKVLAGALERTPEERSVYLDHACGDPDIRREVDSLIAAHEQGDSSFMERPGLGLGSNEALKSGTKLGPYEILARLGAGGMGVVYRARDGRLERDVAIKVLPSGLLADEAARKRFRREALALAKLNHPNIATVYDVGEQEGADYLVMECVPGKSLAEEAASASRPDKGIIALGKQIAAALEEAHEQGVVHRDLKPGNIMVTPKGQVKVLDFGLARILQAAGDPHATESFAQTGNLAGTLPYMAPEQLRGEPADARTDIHALGAVLFESATGQRVYQENSTPQLTDAILHREPVSPRALNARVSPELERIILKCLEKERESRYQSAKEIGVDLRRLNARSAATATVAARPTSRRRVALPLAGTLVVALALAVGGYFYFHRAPKVTEKDSIVVADFTNTTGDPVFDGALRQGLSVQLEQTPFLRVLSGDQVSQTLKMMEQPVDARLTPSLAREVCQRTNATAEIEGSIAALGNQYVLGLNAVNCATGEALAQEQVTASSKEKVLPALGDAASELRSKLGESRASLKTYDVPLTQATTSSLEALQAYNQGIQELWKGDFPSAISSFQRAVDLDPNFVMAYAQLGAMYGYAQAGGFYGAVGNNDLNVKNAKRAYDLRDRTSEYERLTISAYYHLSGTRNLEKAAQFFEQITKTYPRDPEAWNGLGVTALELGRYDQATVALLEAVRLNPSSFSYGNLSWGYLLQDRFEDARATIGEARARHIEPGEGHFTSYQLDLLQNNQAGMAEQVAHPWTDTPSGLTEEVQGATAAYSGHLSLARDWNRRAIASATSAQLKDVVASYKVASSLREALIGNFVEARKEAKEASSATTDPEARGSAALALALSGDPAEAQKLSNDLNQRFPEGTWVRYLHLPQVQAALALGQGNPQKAIESLSAAGSYELAPVPGMMPVYLRGEAYLAAHEGAKAASEFQKILDHRGLVVDAPTPIGALAHLGLGRAYALEGDTAKARAAYQDFLTLWKDADPDSPIFKQARAEYARLQ